jgi:hypothetical protein
MWCRQPQQQQEQDQPVLRGISNVHIRIWSEKPQQQQQQEQEQPVLRGILRIPMQGILTFFRSFIQLDTILCFMKT